MKVVALTSKNPGIRHQAHLWALKELPIDLVCVEISEQGIFAEKFKRQLHLLPRKGLVPYTKWRLERYTAGPLRQEVTSKLAISLATEPFHNFVPAIQGVFNGFSDALVDFIESQHADFVMQLGVGLVPGHFIRRVPPILNLHPGILPGIRGLDPIFWAHYYGREDWCGTTLHIIDEGIDTGKPLLRRRFKPRKNSHFADSVRDQIFLEMELLRLFFTNYPNDLARFDEGGCEKSVYRSTWSAIQYQDLAQANWWGPVAVKPEHSGSPKSAAGFWKWMPTRANLFGGATK